MTKGTTGGFCSFPSVLCVVLEAGEAHEDLLQGYLAHRVVLQAVLLFGFLQGAEDLRGMARRSRRSPRPPPGMPRELLPPGRPGGERHLPRREGGGTPGGGLFSTIPDPI